MQIKEVIVVEGKDDVMAVKKAVDAEVITTGGSHISQKTLDIIKEAYQRRGIIILTDPDYAGKKIRKIVTQLAPKAKQAFIRQPNAMKKGDIGVENASPEIIQKAIEEARPEIDDFEDSYDLDDMVKYRLTGYPDSKKRREVLGHILGIGYANSKQFAKRLKGFGIKRQELEEALENLED